MLRCIAIDDEDLALELLVDNISKVPYLELVQPFNNPLSAMHFLQQQKIDLVFLDIQMPGLTGLQFIRSLSYKPMFILVTAYEKYALDGYSLDVVDYLVKPVPLDRFMQACNKALQWHQLKTKSEQVKEDTATYFFINADYSYVKVLYADIMYVEGLKDYIKIHLKSSSKPLVTRMSMKTLEDQLPSKTFIRVQKSYIVSKEYISAIRKNSIFIGTIEIPVGENYKEAITSLLGKEND